MVSVPFLQLRLLFTLKKRNAIVRQSQYFQLIAGVNIPLNSFMHASQIIIEPHQYLVRKKHKNTKSYQIFKT